MTIKIYIFLVYIYFCTIIFYNHNSYYQYITNFSLIFQRCIIILQFIFKIITILQLIFFNAISITI